MEHPSSAPESLEKRALGCRVAGWMNRRSTWEITAGLFLFALALRVAVAFLRGLNTVPPEGDELGYYQLAQRIIHGLGYSRLWPDGTLRPFAGQMPGTSVFIALGLRALGEHPSSDYLMAAFISSFSAPLIYLYTRRIASQSAAVIAAVACALYPTWLFYSTSSLSEPYFVPLLLLAMLASAWAFSSSSSAAALLAGLAWGAATLVRPHGLPMAALIACYFAWRSRWRDAALVVLGVSLFVGPWLVRNQRALGAPVLATETGETFLGSNNPYVLADPGLHGMWLSTWAIPPYRAMIEFNYNELERSKLQNKVAWAYLRQNPRVIPLLAIYKVRRWLTPVTHVGGAIRLAVLASYGPLLVLLLIGWLRRSYHRSIELELALMWSFVMTVITIVYWGNLTRGRIPLEMVWLPWGAIAAVELLEYCASRRRIRKYEFGKIQLADRKIA